MSDKPVWEETWEFSPHTDEEMETYGPYAEVGDLTVYSGDGRDEYLDKAARLAACAPEAIRLLLEAEWVDQEYEVDDGDGYSDTMTRMVCQFCQRERRRGHFDDCRWLALMKKAGVR